MGTTSMTVFGGIPNATAFINEMGDMIAKSQLAGCKSKDQGKFFAMTCLARRCDPMFLAQRYDIIPGKKTQLRMKSVVMLGLFRRLGGRHVVIERTPERSQIELILDGQAHRFSITWEEALEEEFTQGKEEGEVKSNYNTPRKRMQMMWYRVVSDGVSVMAPEILDGTEDFPQANGQEPEITVHTGTDSPVVVDSSTPDASSTTPADSSGSGTPSESEVIDADYTVKGSHQSSGGELQSETSAPADDRTRMSVNEPLQLSQRETIMSLMRALAQSGMRDIGDRVKAKLAQHNLAGLNSLTVAEGDALIHALQVKEVEVWATQALVGHEAQKKTEPGQTYDDDIPF